MSHLLPSLESLGLWGYWIVGALAFLEAFILTSVFAPGTVVVVLGGALAARGIYDLGDMIAFVAVGTILGAEASFRAGAKGEGLFQEERTVLSIANLDRGKRFFIKWGAASIVIGHFFGPLRPIAPVVAGLSHMPAIRFALWNVVGGLAYAVVFPTLGYVFGASLNLASAITTRAGLALAGVLGAILILWLLALKLRRAWPLIVSILRSVGRAIRDNPDVRALLVRHPRVVRFASDRLSQASFMGLPLTILAIAFGYFLLLYADSTLDVVSGGPLVQADLRIANLLASLRDPKMVRFFTTITTLGHWRAVLILTVAASALLALRARVHYLPGLWLALVGNQITVTLLKLAFARPRPDLAVYAESSFSFPSGHAAASAAFYGVVTYILVRERLGPALLVVMIGVTLVALIGLSRIYLCEHFLSDVLNGYLVGALWALLGILLAEWLVTKISKDRPVPLPPWRRLAGLGVVCVASLALWLVVQDYKQALTVRLAAVATHLDGPVEVALAEGRLPSRSENILGTPQEPISVVILSQDEAAFLEAFRLAGWQTADAPGIRTLARAAMAAWFNGEDITAPVTPGFWNSQPNDFGFEAEAASTTVRQRHHARFWRTGVVTQDGLMVFVGTASFDDGLKWGVTHRISPDIDSERERLAGDLTAHGRATLEKTIQLVPALSGENLAGDPFFTDGRTVLLKVGPRDAMGEPNIEEVTPAP